MSINEEKKNGHCFPVDLKYKKRSRSGFQNQSIAIIKHHLQLKLQEVLKAHPEPRHSLHEGLGYIEEEMHELRMEIFQKKPDMKRIIDEAYDVMITVARLVEHCMHENNTLEWKPELKVNGKYPDDEYLH